MGKVFLSYTREDFSEAYQLYTKLCADNNEVWFDMESIQGGQNWAREIAENIEQSIFFIPFITQTYIYKQGYVQVEIRLALEKQQTMPEGKSFIIPVRFENVRPLYREICKLEYIDLFPSFDEGFRRLLEALHDNISKFPIETSPFTKHFLAKRLEQGKACLRQGYFAGARKHFGEILELNPGNEEAALLFCISEFNGAAIWSQHSDFIDKINRKLVTLLTSDNESIQRQVMVFLAILRIDYYYPKHRRFLGPDYLVIRKFLLKRLPSKEELEYLMILNFTSETRRKLNLFE